MQCHSFLATNTNKLAELLREAESSGELLEEAFEWADVAYWLEHIDWQSHFISVVLSCAKNPSKKILRPLVELFGRDQARMRV